MIVSTLPKHTIVPLNTARGTTTYAKAKAKALLGMDAWQIASGEGVRSGPVDGAYARACGGPAKRP